MKIIRVGHSDNATFGVLKTDDDMPFAVTAELPWKDNQVGVSCIPKGTYECKRIISPKFGETFEIIDVPGRTHILFHKGNNPPADSKGCILIAEEFGTLNGEAAILASGRGFAEFLQKVKNLDSFILNIISCE